jgi:NCS1 family nucleobase:cation symporter-1
MATVIERRRTASPAEAPPTLLSVPPRPLGLADQAALWGNLGVSLTLPVAAAFVLAPAGLPALSLAAALTAVVVGSLFGSTVLGLAAVPGAQTGAPAMVLLRGLFGRRGSYLPTVLNIGQCVGWATVEVVIIADSASRLTGGHLRGLYVVLAGMFATALALRPLGLVRTLRRYAVWLVLLASAYLFVQVLRNGLPPLGAGSWAGFWPAADVVIAIAVSWAPLASDYSRHSRSGRDAFAGALVGFATASTAYFALGLFALATIVGRDGDVLGALLAVPAGGIALAILVLDEVDEVFANVYSTAVSVQNLRPALDRRVLAVVVGVLAVVLGLLVDIVAYESFLYLVGSVFVPLFAVALVDYFLVRRGAWDLSETARGRWQMVLPWALGFATYQLVNPGTVSWWASLWGRISSALHFTPQSWMSASLLSFAVAGLATLVTGRLAGRAPTAGTR